MSDDSVRDNATDPQDAQKSTTAPTPESVTGEKAAKRGKLRQLILIGLLGLMSLALAYDYRIARPRVDQAYDQIVRLNDQMNLMETAKPTLNTDIHKEIGRTPLRTYTDGHYRIEVFSWTAGLPFRTHDLFAVYVANGNDLVFMRHYKFEMPDDELNPPKRQPIGASGEDLEGEYSMPEAPNSMTMEGPMGRGQGGPGRGGESGGEDRPQRPSGDSEDENPGAEEGSPIPPESAGYTPPVSTPSDDAPADGAPADASAPEASSTPADTPADAQPPAESNPAPAASEAKKKDA